jgi:hypothetical protein
MTKLGRPRKYTNGRKSATVRFRPQTYARLKAEAEHNARSISEEVEWRIEETFRRRWKYEIEDAP